MGIVAYETFEHYFDRWDLAGRRQRARVLCGALNQFFDFKGRTPPTRTVSNITIRKQTGDFLALGTLRGNPGDSFHYMTLEDIDFKLSGPLFEPGEVKNITSKTGLLNDVPFNSTSTTE